MSIESYQKQEFLDLLNGRWKTFFKKFKQIEEISPYKWKPQHHVAYFASKYNNHYKTLFSFSLTGAPSKCTEIFLMKKIIGMLATSNQNTVKEYIDWIFEFKIKDRKIKSLGFLANNQLCNEFKLWKKELNKITRSTKLPNNYQEIVNSFNLPVNTFGDLAFVKSALDIDPKNEQYSLLFQRLYSIGFEYDMLKDLK